MPREHLTGHWQPQYIGLFESLALDLGRLFQHMHAEIILNTQRKMTFVRHTTLNLPSN